MNDTTLAHYGVLGMKWGVRRTEAQLARARGERVSSDKKTTEKKATATAKKSTSSEPEKKKSVSEMSDDEIRQKINRLQLEKTYRDLSKSSETVKTNKGKDFVKRVLERSGENIATQLTTYVMGKAVNKALSDVFKEDVVNPKKGQKDK